MVEQRLIKESSVQKEEELQRFPLVETWIEESLPAFNTQNLLRRTLLANQETQIQAPTSLIPVMKLWAEKGPTVLTSYSHPEAFEFYKCVGNSNLSIFVDEIAKKGVQIQKEQIVENWYETVDLERSVTAPLRFGGAFPIQDNFFGLGSSKVGTEPLPFSRIYDALTEINPNLISQKIIDRLSTELDAGLRELKLNKPERKTRTEAIREVINTRVSTIRQVSMAVRGELLHERGMTINDFLIEAQQRISGLVLSRGLDPKARMEDITNIKGSLSSRNQEFLELIMGTLQMIGVQPLKEMVEEDGQGLFVGQMEGRNLLISVDKLNDRFVAAERRQAPEFQISDERLFDFVTNNNFQPLAKAETLALVAGGMTFHMGSEHGNRDRAIQALGITSENFPELQKYLSNLRIGQDYEQGNRLFYLEGNNNSISATLAYILFGPEMLADKFAEVAGTTSVPFTFSEKDFKKFCANEFIRITSE